MPKVIEFEGHMTNAEVHEFIKNKRAHHKREDDDAKAQGEKPAPRPQNYLNSLASHEKHLEGKAYPYMRNPSSYEGTNKSDSFQQFSEEHMEKIQKPIYEQYKEKVRDKLMTVKEAQDEMGELQEKKELTETEYLMIVNNAPTVVEMLHPMIEDCDERYTSAELETMVEIIKDCFHKDELAAEYRAKHPLRARALMTEGPVIDQDAPILSLRQKPATGPTSSGANAEGLGAPNRLE